MDQAKDVVEIPRRFVKEGTQVRARLSRGPDIEPLLCPFPGGSAQCRRVWHLD